ncbi:MAG: restriction endonuclease subunit S [Acidobacteria bacterium]|nr:restriction endonuclease subunit S [Acidobacteriota bacterium]
MVREISSPLGAVPQGWSLARLAYLTSKIGSGATPRGGESAYLPVRDKYALVRSQNVFDRQFDAQKLVFITDQDARLLDNVELRTGDVLLNITGDGITFARSCLVDPTILPARVNQHVIIIRCKEGLLDPGYLLSFLTHPQIKLYMESFNAGGSRRALTKGHIESFVVPLPPISEQRAIARILCSFDDKIELNRQMNATLEAMAQALFKSWFVDFDPVKAKAEGRAPEGMDAETAALFPSVFEESELGPIPKGWEVGALDDFLVLQRGFDLPSASRVPGPFPILAASGPSGTHNEYKVKGPGVTTGRSGVLGNVFFVHEDFWPLNTSLWVKEFKISKTIHAYHLLKTIDVSTFNAGSAVPTLNRNHVHGLQTVVPPYEVIQYFEEAAAPMFRCVHRNEKESRTLAGIRAALLPRIISGQLRIPEAEAVATGEL